jgi:hypothetical protein
MTDLTSRVAQERERLQAVERLVPLAEIERKTILSTGNRTAARNQLIDTLSQAGGVQEGPNGVRHWRMHIKNPFQTRS